MPRFRLQRWDGITYECSTADPETGAKWLHEMLTLYQSPNYQACPWTLWIYPLWVPGPYRVEVPDTGYEQCEEAVQFSREDMLEKLKVLLESQP